MQEVAKLRRSLDDAEGLSRDTKKEWAVLRSQKITLEETVVSPGHEFSGRRSRRFRLSSLRPS